MEVTDAAIYTGAEGRCQREINLQSATGYSLKPLTASVTLCPPNPKELERATST